MVSQARAAKAAASTTLCQAKAVGSLDLSNGYVRYMGLFLGLACVLLLMLFKGCGVAVAMTHYRVTAYQHHARLSGRNVEAKYQR